MVGVFGTECAERRRMAHHVEEFPLYDEARRFTEAATATLRRSALVRGTSRYKQIDEAIDSILSNMKEGFEQESDDAFAKYLFYSKGSVAEVVRRLEHAANRGEAPKADVDALAKTSEVLGKMLGGFIKYLKVSGFKDRGRFRFKQAADSRSKDSGSTD